MTLIRNAHIFKAELPQNLEDFEDQLATDKFVDPLPSQPSAAGFVHVRDDELVAKFHGGFAFAYRIDTKVIPSSAVQAEVAARVKRIEELEGTKPGRKQRREIKEDVVGDLCLKALARTTIVNCFYHTEKQYLIVATTSESVSDRILTALVRAVGSVKTETIHVSNVKHGLTTRLSNWLTGSDDAFGEFEPCGEVTLLSPDKLKMVVKAQSLHASCGGLMEAIGHNHGVVSLRLSKGTTSFRLTDSFKLKAIETPLDEGTEIEEWSQLASFEVMNLSDCISALCSMFSYKG